MFKIAIDYIKDVSQYHINNIDSNILSIKELEQLDYNIKSSVKNLENMLYNILFKFLIYYLRRLKQIMELIKLMIY